MTITISNDDLHLANEQLVMRIADLERELDTVAEECRDAQSTAQQFKDERDQAHADAEAAERATDAERLRADGLHAANFALVADHIRRQDRLSAAAKTWRTLAARRQDQLNKAHAEIRDLDSSCWAMRDQLNRVVDENRDLRTELANQPKPRWRRRDR